MVRRWEGPSLEEGQTEQPSLDVAKRQCVDQKNQIAQSGDGAESGGGAMGGEFIQI